jgi:hypothetical protein
VDIYDRLVKNLPDNKRIYDILNVLFDKFNEMKTSMMCSFGS